MPWLLGGMLLPGFAARADEAAYAGQIKPLLKEYCLGCHSTEKQKGDLDLERFGTLEAALREPKVWQQVVEQIENGEMPPAKKPQPSAAQRQELLTGAKSSLAEWARAHAGDPGPVVLRRLSNAEYAWTLRDLTGVPELNPGREFPVDGAAGEGFTNAGAALVMSPALVGKYLEAAKEVAAHAVLLPDGIAFSASTTRRDWTEERLAAIRAIYARYAVPGEGMALNLQGLRFDTLDGGVIPLEKYFAATLEEREALASGRKEIGALAKERGLSAKYLGLLWQTLSSSESSYPLDEIRGRWQAAKPGDAAALAAAVKQWQRGLWQFHSIGQIGKRNGPKSWQEAVNPVVAERELRLKLPAEPKGELTLTLSGDQVRWENARLIRGNAAPLPLAGLEAIGRNLEALMAAEIPRTAEYLDALAQGGASLEAVAAQHGLNSALLAKWSALAGIGHSETPEIGGHFTEKLSNIAGNPLLRAWGSPQTPSMTVNASTEAVRFSTINAPARSVFLHPSPVMEAAIAWRSPISGRIRVSGEVADADGTCGNGVAWRVELKTRRGPLGVAVGVIDNGGREAFASEGELVVQEGDLLVLGIQPRDGQHICDTTQVSLDIKEAGGGQHWNLADEVVDRVHESNPLADRAGHPAVWHFCALPLDGKAAPLPGAGTMLAKWRDAVEAGGNSAHENALAVQAILTNNAAPAGEADRGLRGKLLDAEGPLAWLALASGTTAPAELKVEGNREFRIPAALARGAEFVATVRPGGGVLPRVAASLTGGGSSEPLPLLAAPESVAQVKAGFDRFREVFPAALCYSKIVPVDEVITLRLFYREDDTIRRLMLADAEASELDRLWRELDFVSLAPLRMVDAYEQLWQYATQDADPGDLEPLRKPVAEGAERFKSALSNAEPVQLDAVIAFAAKSWRRPLEAVESERLRALYAALRKDEMPHEDAVRLVLARVLTAPAFLYKMETPGPTKEAVAVNDYELATRLAYFLWSSAPDDELLALAAQGKLRDPQTLAGQAHRMLGDAKVRRLAIEFGTQWLHVRGFDQLDEKSEAVFPEFAGIRAALNEEPIRFFTELFQHDGRVRDLLDADHAFVNGALAKYYGIPGVEGEVWQRVEGMKARGRGGILGFGATLARQSGASRTSPILRGTWVCETILGEHLPSPPKGVPVLPEQPPAGLSERALTELHAKDPACARCHTKIDPYGFALEHYDAIGRFRVQDITGQPVQAASKLPDGREIEGIDGLRGYLLNQRGDDFTRQFCRKLLGYALGRGVLLSDEPLLDEIQAALKDGDQHVGIAIDKIVRSKQFREIRGKEHRDE